MSRLKSFITLPIAIVLGCLSLAIGAVLIWAPPDTQKWVISALAVVGGYVTSHMKPPGNGPKSSGGHGLGVPMMLLSLGIGAASLQGCGASSYDRHTIAVQGLQLTSMVAKDVVNSEFVGRLTHGDMPPTVSESLRMFDSAIAAYAIGVERYADGQLGNDDVLPLALAAYGAFQDLLALLRSFGVDTSGIPLFGGVE